jgi:hypothetical protein
MVRSHVVVVVRFVCKKTGAVQQIGRRFFPLASTDARLTEATVNLPVSYTYIRLAAGVKY